MRKALVVGINEYGNLSLKGSHIDASNIAETLKYNGDDSTNFEVKLLLDLKKLSLRKSLVDLFSDTNEISLFYFSGHGYLGPNGHVYLASSDGAHYDPGILIEEVLSFVNTSKALKKIIFLDCCYAGAIANNRVQLMPNIHLSEGVEMLLATRDTDSQKDFATGSLFTNSLIIGLKGGAADSNGDVYTSSLFAFAEQNLRGSHPNPIYKSCVSQFALLRSHVC